MSDSLIENIGRKVPYCKECQTAEFTREETTVDDRGKLVRICEFCGDRLTLRSQDRVHSFVERPVLHSELNAPRSSVTRWFTSPWGRVKAHISVHSYFAPFVELNGVPCPAIKRVIDEEFSQDAIQKAAVELMTTNGVLTNPITTWQWSAFIDNLRHIVWAVMINPHAVPELDLDEIEHHK